MISRVSNSEVLQESSYAASCPPRWQTNESSFWATSFAGPLRTLCTMFALTRLAKYAFPVGKRRQKRPLDSWTRKSVVEALSRASRSLPVSVRPNALLQPLTSGSLYARNISYNKTMWCQLAQRRTNAPAGSRAGPAGILGAPPRARAAPAPGALGDHIHIIYIYILILTPTARSHPLLLVAARSPRLPRPSPTPSGSHPREVPPQLLASCTGRLMCCWRGCCHHGRCRW